MPDDGTTPAIDPLAETLIAQISSPPGTDLAAVISRLNDVSKEIQQITADVAAHGAPIGLVAMGMIGRYATAWDRLTDGVRRVAKQGGLIDAGQLLGVMQELHDRFEFQTRPPKDHPEDLAKENTDG